MLDQSTNFAIEGCVTATQLLRKRAGELGAKTALREKVLGIWQDVSWADYYDRVKLYGAGLLALGFQRGEVLAIIADPMKEWVFFDLAAQGCGGIGNGIYTTDSPEQVGHICADSRACLLVVENEEQLDKWLEVRADLPGIRKVIVLDDKGLKEFSDPDVMMLAEFEALARDRLADLGAEFETRLDGCESGETSILVYTSGTTGKPKGAMISHANALFQGHVFRQFFTTIGQEETVSYLPLCHIAERVFSVLQPIDLGATVHFVEGQDTTFENIQEVSPTVFFGVPRIWEKMYSGVNLRLRDATWLGRTAFGAAMSVGARVNAAREQGKPVGPALSLANWLGDVLVLRNIKVMLGLDRVRIGVSAAAPISPDLLRWFGALGVPIYEIYGQTESSGGMTGNAPGQVKLGSVGVAYPEMEIRIASDGEIMARGPLVFQGYLNMPEKTAETVVDGWLMTGDVGYLDNEGFLRITDRKKDIIITAGGKNITPSEIENQLKFSPYISDAVVIGDRRKYLTCLVMIDHDNVAEYAQERGVPFSDFTSLCHTDPVQDLIRAEVEQVNTKFARVETIKDFRLIDRLLTAEDEELTATMKLKRGFVEKKYSALIDAMYGAT